MDVAVAPSIAVLSADLASQIAAGEVVERPASVVKELVENALDAGARRIEVSIEGGGLARIAVKDDGHGMSPGDAPRALLRHATSKLRALTDLEHIGSYGFRGEALPSIASVSRTRIVTRTKSEDAALQLVAEGTTDATEAPLGAPVGTLVEVRELFFNVPARRKFLRSSNTESGHVTDVIEGLALGRPDVALSLERDGRIVRSYLRGQSRKERAAAVLDDEQLLEVQGARGPLGIEAFLAHPEEARSGTQGLRLLVNGRVVRDRGLAATVAHAYGGLERGQYPRGVVYLDLLGTLVDVNVHPQKAEVRFADPRAVQGALHGLLAPAIARKSWSPARSSQRGAGSGATSGATEETALAPTHSSAPLTLSDVRRVEERLLAGGPARTDGARLLPLTQIGATGFRVHGVLENGLVLVESARGVLFIDPHALAERALLRELTALVEAGPLTSERLVFPLRFELERPQISELEQRSERLARLGFDLRAVGERAATLFAAPSVARASEPVLRATTLDLVAARDLDDAAARTLAALACAATHERGAASLETVAALLDGEQLDAPAPPAVHARVVVRVLGWKELERPEHEQAVREQAEREQAEREQAERGGAADR